ncbi:multidrug effflux MFS transporter [Alcanivorax sp. JB21]|uniref:multidrug effflux MFS transporter n=1 Tax=Alcanivorax limicola TaxID=2874102 RepID=UPI001CBEC937|nr:multidrug effflux MFS transporter [Alcanivorax limicola]MBZ2187905.1 multidrug effflux MFS transporter [Alcanivorax limicola]
MSFPLLPQPALSAPSATSTTRLALVLGMLVAIGPLAIDMYLPALPAMAESLSVSVERIEASVSIYLFGTALGQLLGGPLSDRYGRKAVASAGLLLFAVACVGVALSNSLTGLLGWRLLQALGGGATVVIAAASVRDFHTGREAARLLTTIGLVMLVAPLAAPALGATILHLLHWQGIFIALAAYAVLMVAVLNTALPTAANPMGRPAGGIIAAYGRVLRNRQAMGFILANALSFAAMFVFITDSAFFYMTHFAVSSAVFPILFGANVVVMITLNRLNILLLRRYDSPAMMRAGLIMQWLAASALLVLVLLGALTLERAVPLVMIAVGSVALIIPNALASFLSLFEQDAGAATGLNGALQFLLAGLAGGLVTLLHTSSALPMALTMVVCSSLAGLAFVTLRK